MTDCPFCLIATGQAPATVLQEWDDALVIVPIGPVVEGHVLVIPRTHVADFSTDPTVSAAVMARAAEYAGRSDRADRACNLITSRGRDATQSVFHLHIHLVPRSANDGLALPWYSGRRKSTHPTKGAPS